MEVVIKMPILKSEDGKDLIVSCSCGCDNGVHINIKKYDDEYAWMTYMNGNWYRDQNKRILYIVRDKLRKIWAIIRSKDFYYSEILMSRKDFETFREYINGVKE